MRIPSPKITPMYITYRFAPFPMELSDHELWDRGHSPTTSLLNAFSYCCAAVGKISTDTARRAFPLR